MPNPQLSILVVDDAKFSSVMIGRALSKAGYEDIRFANSASAALELIEQRPANVLLADWLMPEMDGLELTAQVRQQDEMSDHYTYIILLTGRDGQDVLSKAFDHGVDDFIGKSVMNDQLVPRVFAADRLCGSLQRLMRENRLLTENIASLEKRNLIDPITGLGNSRYLHQRLGDSLRQIESRGGALCFLLIGLPEVPSQRERYGEQFHQDLLRGVARRIQQLVRPLDVLTRLDDRHFGVLTLIDDLRGCAPSSFKRLHEGLNLKAFKTDEGFISIKAGIAMISLDASALPVDPKRVIAEAGSLLPDAYATGRIVPMRYKQPA
ncbi:response regulator [Stutzerimonas zhaodongensis]|jgi:diguanylate cyclase (GGDEF)-like protein|uniref:Diguanylate cyclase n=1 Tax=Stutzerimonas zhaodongensis TaxID=1176257 RepID=A0A365PQ35_9GAMM|nr:response regulator [Stutzerimonas zhaodongensis]QWV19027.1 response regulator [Stutzerimonas zhaodongensis]RBA52043.1 diguanylate cyclase [Stutzerimonas zhaodongensis]